MEVFSAENLILSAEKEGTATEQSSFCYRILQMILKLVHVTLMTVMSFPW
jgi:hypothetical protein